MSLIGGLGGLIGLGIAATAAFTLIDITNHQLAKCKVCDYSNPNKQAVVRHVQRMHPREFRAAHAKMRAKTSQRRRVTYLGY